jgi:integrase
MQLLPGLYRRGKNGIWCVRKDVPAVLRARLGRTSLKESLHTTDLAVAIVRYHKVMALFEQKLADARKPADADLWKPFTIQLPPEMTRHMYPPPTGPRLPVVLEEWARHRQPRQNTVEETRRTMGQFIALNGDHVIGAYTVKQARDWRDLLVGNENAHATKAKRFREIATLFKFAWKNDHIETNPFERVTLERPKRAYAAKRPEWSLEQLRVWFSSPVFTERYRPQIGEIAFWCVPLALFHGMRLGEIAQLDRSDLKLDDGGVWYLRVEPSDDDDGVQGKSAKTEESIRKVPVHRRVIESGFIEYANTLNGTKLFPGVRPDSKGRWSGRPSDWFNKYRRKLGIGERWTDFHALRGTWKTGARGAKIVENVHDEITGHANGSVGRTYGRVPIPQLKEAVDKVDFDLVIPKWTAV